MARARRVIIATLCHILPNAKTARVEFQRTLTSRKDDYIDLTHGWKPEWKHAGTPEEQLKEIQNVLTRLDKFIQLCKKNDLDFALAIEINPAYSGQNVMAIDAIFEIFKNNEHYPRSLIWTGTGGGEGKPELTPEQIELKLASLTKDEVVARSNTLAKEHGDFTSRHLLKTSAPGTSPETSPSSSPASSPREGSPAAPPKKTPASSPINRADSMSPPALGQPSAAEIFASLFTPTVAASAIPKGKFFDPDPSAMPRVGKSENKAPPTTEQSTTASSEQTAESDEPSTKRHAP